MNIGFISTRLAGTDGVSLEAAKLATVLRRMGHDIFYCAGELDNDVPGLLAQELHFTDPAALSLGKRAFAMEGDDRQLVNDIDQQAQILKRPLRTFFADYQIDFVIAQNVFAIPMQLPFAQALSELLTETGIPALAHNHDLYWERERFQTNCIRLFLDTYFPPDLPLLKQAVINSAAQRALKQRRGLDSIIIPNVFDFEIPPPGIDAYNADFRQVIGLSVDDKLILQPTRVIPRKGIELSIELLAQLGDPKVKLVITHEAGDEGFDYLYSLQRMAQAHQVELLYVADRVGEKRGFDEHGRKIYSLWDSYVHADLVTYPSFVEGFGNALIETIYFRLPAMVNRYPVYIDDIAPKGFEFVEIDGKISSETVKQVRQWLDEPEATKRIVDENFRLGQEYYSFQTLADCLESILPL